ncbi:peptide ABC transporter permease [Haematobacter missouriensis]|uniref:EamA/RhaT family transporter n=1 Tax=Haematobacter missouriensis TaxID=366616 RepID=A0A212AJM3_9RHOB|nr:DMT family transporter [Haematobacter missouriensis]KFI32847.1 peptide ABC transporter permease [Haematobacter missouriensis]OWJ74634.1 EamA/RhaT family transporter [Haematobacter missouriensis]OWJ81677.1 EamA/RhaT family transporter [Haematobacter missouriensis]
MATVTVPPISPEADSQPFTGMLWMFVSGLSFVGVNVFVKIFGQGLPAAESAFLRFGFGLLFLLPLAPAFLRQRPTRRIIGQIWARGGLHAVGVICWFYAMTSIPLQEVTAINYLTPIYVTLGAAVFFGERLAMRRIVAILVAIVGVMVILRPGVREVEPGHLAMLTTTACFGASFLFAKRLSEEMNPAFVVAWMSVTVTILLAPLALMSWVQPSLAELGGMAIVAGCATFGHYAMTRAFRLAPVSVTQPVTFLQLIWATLIGAAAFGEAADIWVVVGAAMIISAVAYVTLREARLKRGQTPAGVTESA